jgi:hypothetical protein
VHADGLAFALRSRSPASSSQSIRFSQSRAAVLSAPHLAKLENPRTGWQWLGHQVLELGEDEADGAWATAFALNNNLFA